MRLVEIKLELQDVAVSPSLSRLLADAERCIADWDSHSSGSIPAFVASDFGMVYRALVSIRSQRLETGQKFVEWGSGLGIVACLAEWTGFDAVGIEIEPRLVSIAESLAAEHGVAVQFACGSFVPRGAEPRVDRLGEVAWLSTNGADGYDELDLEPDDFDLVFAYPWPGEEQVIFDLFADHAAVGALLLTYHGQEGLRLQRKLGR